MSYKQFEGVYPAMLTPYKGDGLDEDSFRKMIDFGKKKGLTGFFPVSSVGDFACLSIEEKKKLIDITAEEAKGYPIFPGISSSDRNESIAMAEYAAKKGCAGVVACPPYYYPLSEVSLAEHFVDLARNIKIPLILYNIPLFTAPITKKVFELLKDEKNIIGMKDSSGSIVELMHFLDLSAHRDFCMFTGREEGFLAALVMGAKGSMTATAALFPEAMVAIWNLFKEGDLEKATKVQKSFISLIRLCMAQPFPHGFRLAMEARGFQMGRGRQYLSKQDGETLEKIKDSIKEAVKKVESALKNGGLHG